MKTVDMPIIELSGTPRERGLIHGESLKTQISEVLEHWLCDLGNYGLSTKEARRWNATEYLNGFFANTSYLKAIERWAPDLLEEIKAIAEASGQPFKQILGLNLMDEEWVYGLRQSLDKPTHKCTAFAAPDQAHGVSYAGQNMDICSWSEGYQALFRLMPTNTTPEVLVFSIAGSIGFNGLNAKGLGVTCNTLSQLNFATDGLPVVFIVRSILEQHSLDAAVTFIKTIRHASGQNYIVSSADQMHCFECCGSSVIPYAPAHLKGSVFHTNHPLINTDISSLKELSQGSTVNTQARLSSITRRLGDTHKLLTLDEIKAALSAHDDSENPVSRCTNEEVSSIGYTAGSVIYEFTPKPQLHLAAGPPCETPFCVFDFASPKTLAHGARRK